MRSGFATIWLLMLCAAAPSTTAPSYSIALSKTSKKGDKVVIEMIIAIVTDSSSRWVGREPETRQTTRGLHLVAEDEVIEIDKAGHSIKDCLTIRSCAKLDGEHESELIAAGKQIIVEPDGAKTRFTMDGEPVSEECQTLLSRGFSLPDKKQSVSRDQVFGSNTPRRVGETWPIDAAAMAKSYAMHGSQVKVEDISGDVKLAAVESFNGMDCLRVESDVKVKDVRSSDAEKITAAGAQLKESSLRSHAAWLMPIDVSKPLQSYASSSTWRRVIRGKEKGWVYENEDAYREEIAVRVLP